MGSISMKCINLDCNDIFFISDSHVTIYTDKKKLDVTTLYFPSHEKELYYNVINDATHGDKLLKLYYHNKYTHCVVVDHSAYPSESASPTSFGWSYVDK